MRFLKALATLGLIFCMPAAPGLLSLQGGEKPPSVTAFPGAEGFGAMTRGGRGGRVMEVTNLNDSGPGSLRACLEASGPRICVFRTGGTIEVASPLTIANPFITVAGQTAPGDGVTLRNAPGAVLETTVRVETHDVVIRYLTIRRGPGGEGDCLCLSKAGIDKVYNVIIDHCTFSWGVDENASTWYAAHDCSIQWSILSECLDCSTHSKGCHSKGFMMGSYASDETRSRPGAYNISFHHNLLAHNGERNPQVKTAGLADVVNNVVYNPHGTFSHVDMERQLVKVLANYVGNYFKSGPNTEEKSGIRVAYPGPIGAEIYVEGNLVKYRNGRELEGIDTVERESRRYLVNARHPAAPIVTAPASDAYRMVLDDAGADRGLGCDGTFFGRRDVVDSRIVSEVRNGTGKIIDSPAQVAGWPKLDPGVPCQDTDHDGMPDAWEKLHGLDPKNPRDGSLDLDGDGYTNVEEFLNGTDPAHR